MMTTEQAFKLGYRQAIDDMLTGIYAIEAAKRGDATTFDRLFQALDAAAQAELTELRDQLLSTESR